MLFLPGQFNRQAFQLHPRLISLRTGGLTRQSGLLLWCIFQSNALIEHIICMGKNGEYIARWNAPKGISKFRAIERRVINLGYHWSNPRSGQEGIYLVANKSLQLFKWSSVNVSSTGVRSLVIISLSHCIFHI